MYEAVTASEIRIEVSTLTLDRYANRHMHDNKAV